MENKYKNLIGPASEKQKEVLTKFGIKYNAKITKQQASDLISEKIKNNRYRSDTSYEEYLCDTSPEFAAYWDELNNSGCCPNGMF